MEEKTYAHLTSKDFSHLSVSGESLTGLSCEFKNELGSRLFGVLPDVLPSMQLRYVSGKYYSNKHIDGRTSSDMACTIYENNPFYVRDWADSRRSIDLIQAVIDIEHKEDNFFDALRYLCRCAAMDAPKLSSEQEAYFGLCSRFRTAAKVFHDALMTDRSKEAQAVRDYLTKTGDFKESGRGWSFYDIQESGLGYVSKDSMRLLFTDEELTQLSERDEKIGSRFTLAIPTLTGSRITGMKFRNIFATNKKDRYHALQNSSRVGLSCVPEFGVTDTVIVVEGDMDALHHIAMYQQAGYDMKKSELYPVVATGGNGLTKGMVQDAVQRGIYNFILALDADKAGVDFTLNSARDICQAGGSAFILQYPDCYKDMDEMYCDYVDGTDGKKHHRYNANDIQRMAKDAISFGRWSADRILSTIAPDCGDMDKANVKRKLSALLGTIPNTDKKELQDYLREACKPYRIDADSLSRPTAKDTQNKALSDAYARAAKCYSSGNPKGAEIALKQARNLVSDEEEIKPVTDDSIMDELREHELNSGVKTGWRLCGKELVLPSNGLSVFCLPSNHGKSAILTNICRLALAQLSKPVWFLHYEDDNATYMVNLVKSWNDIEDDITVDTLQKCGEDSILRSAWKLFAYYRTSGKLSLQEANLTTETLCEQALQAAKEEKLGCLIVDYIQLITTSERRSTQKETMTEVCRQLMRLSRQAHIPVVTAAQFNRNPKGPLDMSVHDIADAADIYNQSSCVVFGWNTSKPAEKLARGFRDDGTPDVSNPIISQLVHDGAKFNFYDDEAKTTLYLRVAKSRGIKTGGYGILKYNMASGRIEE